jgi:hypothetical protein
MTKFFLGLVLGLTLGVVFASYAATITGESPLSGWTVTEGEGMSSHMICEDPDIDLALFVPVAGAERTDANSHTAPRQTSDQSREP